LRKLLGFVALLCMSSGIAHASALHAKASLYHGKASYYHARGARGCAHRSLPFGTHVRVTNLSNQHSTTLVVNDRGPFIKGRVIDVSVVAAEQLGFRHAGLAPVRVDVLPD